MFDRIAFRATIDVNDVDTIVLKNYLEQCIRGDEIYYKSTAYANLSGVSLDISGNTLRCKCSINKLYYKMKEGKLDNSKPMTFGHAKRTIQELLMRLSVVPENAVVTYYEIGLTMKMNEEPERYIRSIEEGCGRRMWNDPNYPEMRQKITEKSKYYRKVLKMYDKTFEYREKGRKVDENVLRIESIYRHQSVRMTEFLDNEFQKKMGRKFYADWKAVRFRRDLRAGPGVKLSQLVKAQEISSIGVEEYLNKYREMWKSGEISQKSWRTIREYAQRWEEEKHKYTEIISQEESEYQDKLLDFYQIGIITSKK